VPWRVLKLLCAGLCAMMGSVPAPAVAAALLYATDQRDGGILVFDTVTDAAVATLKVAPGPAMIAAEPNGGRLYVTHPEFGKISVIDGGLLGAPKQFEVSGTPFGVAASSDGRLFVTDWNRDLLLVLDGRTGAKIAAIGVGKSPANVVVSALNKRAFVTNREDDSVSVIDTDRLLVIATVGVGRAPFALAISPDENRIYVANAQSSDVSVLSADSLERLGTVRVGAMPYGVAVTPEGETLFVANQQSGSVFAVDTRSLVVTDRIKVGRYPEAIVMHPDGHKAYVVNWMSGDISVLNVKGGEEIKRLPAGDGIRGLAIMASG
jgi:YVTN family beta-propeller protein